jgi:hypothetical protein
MRILVIDIGGTNVKLWLPGGVTKLKLPSGDDFTPEAFVKGAMQLLEGHPFDRLSIGCPGEVSHGRPATEPFNLAPGWVEFDFDRAFGRPLRMLNDACLQALGGYEGGTMLYLGLGTSIGTALISHGEIVPLALGPLRVGEARLEASLCREALETGGPEQWEKCLHDAVAVLRPAFHADYVLLGGGNAKRIRQVPAGCRRGGNHQAYTGGVRLWSDVLAGSTGSWDVLHLESLDDQLKADRRQSGKSPTNR